MVSVVDPRDFVLAPFFSLPFVAVALSVSINKVAADWILTFIPVAVTTLFVANHAKELTAPVAATAAVAALRPRIASFFDFFMF